MRKLILKIGAFIIPILLMATTSTWGATVSFGDTFYDPEIDIEVLANLDLAQWSVLSSYTNLATLLDGSYDLFLIKDSFGEVAYLSLDGGGGSYTDSTRIVDTFYYLYDLGYSSGEFEAIVVDSTATPEPETYATLLVIFGIGALMYRRQKQGALESMA